MADRDLAVGALYHEYLSSHEPAISPPLAAVLALTSAIGNHSIQTAAEGLLLLSHLAATLKESSDDALAVAAGTEGFQHQISTRPSQNVHGSQYHTASAASSSSDIRDANVEDMKRTTIAAGADFVNRGIEARSRIAKFGRRFLKDGSTVVVPAHSKVVTGVLGDARAAGLSFRVVTTSAEVGRVMEEQNGVATAVVEANALGAALLQATREHRMTNLGDDADILVLSGADVILADGSIICSRPSSEAICLAQSLGIDCWVASESFKACKYMHHEILATSNHMAQASTVIPAAYIAGLLTEDGPISAQALSEETIKFWI